MGAIDVTSISEKMTNLGDSYKNEKGLSFVDSPFMKNR